MEFKWFFKPKKGFELHPLIPQVLRNIQNKYTKLLILTRSFDSEKNQRAARALRLSAQLTKS